MNPVNLLGPAHIYIHCIFVVLNVHLFHLNFENVAPSEHFFLFFLIYWENQGFPFPLSGSGTPVLEPC